jgi:Domain of unknown function (DUF4419)
MSDTTFAVSPNVTPKNRREKVDYVTKLRVALRRPIEATWLPRNMLIACDEDHALLSALKISFYDHLPLRISPDAIWITLARGFAQHVNEHSEQLRHRFVRHTGKETLSVTRLDFLPGRDNPWPEAFDEFSKQLIERTGGMASIVQADFSTTGPVERAVSHLMAMDTFKSYFEYVMYAGCGIPQISLTGTSEDWRRLRVRAQEFADYGLHDWIEALDPVLAQFERAKSGDPDTEFWRSLFRYRSGSGPAVMTGWANVLFPYLKDEDDKLYKNPYLNDWQQHFAVSERQTPREWLQDPQGVGIGAIPSCFTSVPLKVFWGSQETEMRLVGGLMGVAQDDQTFAVEPECGWAVIYEEPVDPLSWQYEMLEERKHRLKQLRECQGQNDIRR